DMYLLKVQDKLHHLELEFEKEFNNALLLFIRRIVIKNKVKDLQLGVESYQRTLNLTKPMLYFEGIDDRIPYTMSGAEKELGQGNERLKGRDWNEKDIKRSKKMLDKIDQFMKRREWLRRLEKYVGGCPKTIDPRVFV
ncbi:hypothetical protein Tco_1362372, partial [Tanacetum coccineum]